MGPLPSVTEVGNRTFKFELCNARAHNHGQKSMVVGPGIIKLEQLSFVEAQNMRITSGGFDGAGGPRPPL